MMIYLLHVIPDPMKVFGGSRMHCCENVCRLEWGRLCDGNYEQHRLYISNRYPIRSTPVNGMRMILSFSDTERSRHFT